MANQNGMVNKFQIPTNSPASLVGTGVVNQFTKILQNSTKPLIQTPNAPVVYTTPGSYTFVVPASQTKPLSFVLAGGGGGGGGGQSSGGGGGGASGVLISGSVLFSPGSSMTVIVGAGGTGGGSAISGNQGDPTQLTYGSFSLEASGGFGGGGGITGSPGLGGAGGANGGAIPYFYNITDVPVFNVTWSLSQAGYDAGGNNGGSWPMYYLGSVIYSGSPPYAYLINGTVYSSGGGSGSTGAGSGGNGGNGFAIFYING